MNTNISHLPEQKRQELQQALEIIQDEINLDMLILFGSYARGDWVEDIDEKTLLPKYQSDFDLLVVTQTPYQAMKTESNNKLKQRLIKEVHRTPTSLIAEDINFINKRLRKSQYFYIDIFREGKMLYDSGKLELTEPREITLKERKKIAQEDFEYWFSKAGKYKKYSDIALNEKDKNESAFFLHQSVESFIARIHSL